VIEGERRLWRELARRIEAGEAGAEEAFHERYAAGVRALLRRTLGPAGLDALVKETLAGAAEDIRRGVLREPKHFVHFVRSVADRHLRTEAAGGARRGTERLSHADRMRLRETQAAVERALAEFTSVEREILASYYSRGFTKRDIEARYGIDGSILDNLRMRMQELVRPQRTRMAPVTERRAALTRGSAAGAG
jgi:DNA-directed RNA polymerase specialized sigma24 family protein